ncbi:MotE family protein [Gracilibacillus marinus]|jgi:flagellar motility protein MotE (MotC chaperone)|uniref:MotE family protein n=1 Tax=Gracilibacillus marinus TaxID=630535 RepID=A0ABV8VWK3_9BACI
MKTNPKSETKKPSILQWLIVIVVPIIFALIITFIILQFMGVDVVKSTKDVLNKIPFISETVMTDQEELHTNELKEKDEALLSANKELELVQAELQAKEKEIQNLEGEMEQLSKQIEDQAIEEEQIDSTDYKELAKSFDTMKPKSAAPILQELNDELAIEILKELDAETRGNLLAQMEAEVAARYTSLLAN